jgi:hypothetical protein
VKIKHSPSKTSNMAAKNHATILPDADREATVNAIVGATFGAAGQRCMALSTAVFVGESKEWVNDIIAKAKKLHVNMGLESDADLGPLISPQAKERVAALIESGVEEGASLALDGRGVVVAKYPKGNFIGPTVLTNVQPHMRCVVVCCVFVVCLLCVVLCFCCVVFLLCCVVYVICGRRKKNTPKLTHSPTHNTQQHIHPYPHPSHTHTKTK